MLKLGRQTDLKIIIAIASILIITFLSFYPCLKNNFTNWDDNSYVTNNPSVRNLSTGNIRRIFSSFSVGNYQPAVILSYLFEYRFFKLKPFGYHLTNLILHLLNCIFVFWLFYLLTRKISVSWLTAVLFGIHPLHVESVAWISERKDVLYACFFLAALICYCYYLRKEKIGKYYYSSLILFIFSLLSKAMAITLPAVLILIDYFLHRKRSKTAILDKIPFFILSFIFGIIAAIGQYSSGAVRQESLFNFVNKIAVSSYGIIFYLNKILAPIKLSCFYSSSGTKEISLFPYTFITVVILLAAVIISSKRTRKIIFGSFLFLITILPVLQFIPIGNIIVADRYIYISSLGIFYLISEGFIWLRALKTKHLYFLQSLMMLIILTGALGILATLTWKRCQVWNNSIVLWSDVLKNYPNEATAYKNRGVAYRDQGNFTQAISDYNRAIELNPNDADPYNNRGVAYRDQGNFTQAISDYNRAIELNPNYADAYYNRALAYQAQGSFAQAISNFSKAIKIDSNLVKAYNNRATAYVQEKNYELALSDLNKAIEITPNDGEVFYNRAVVRFLMKEYAKAWMDIHRAEGLGEKVDPKLIELLRKASENKEIAL